LWNCIVTTCIETLQHHLSNHSSLFVLHSKDSRGTSSSERKLPKGGNTKLIKQRTPYVPPPQLPSSSYGLQRNLGKKNAPRSCTATLNAICL
jgi:hypothetical protein